MDPAFFEDRTGSGALYRPPAQTTALEAPALNCDGDAARGSSAADTAAMELSEATGDAGQTGASAHPPASAMPDVVSASSTSDVVSASAMLDVVSETAMPDAVSASAMPDVVSATAMPDAVSASAMPDVVSATAMPDVSATAMPDVVSATAMPDVSATAMPDLGVGSSTTNGGVASTTPDVGAAVPSVPDVGAALSSMPDVGVADAGTEDDGSTAGRRSRSSSSSSDWMSDLAPGERHEVLRKAYEAAIESDDETGVPSAAGPPRSRNEATELPPVVVRTDVLPETAMIAPLGRISGIVETFVLVQSHSGVAPLDASSLLCLSSRRVLGQVFDVMGRVTDPVYSVRFNVASEIDRALFVPGTPVFSVLSEAVPVFMDRARQKGTDASNLYDEELPEEEQEFSDDEKEAAHKREDKHRHGRRSKGQRMAVDTPAAHGSASPAAAAAGPRVIPPMPAYPMHRPPSSAAPYGSAPPSSQPALNWAPPHPQQQYQQQQQQQQQQQAYGWTRPPAPSHQSQQPQFHAQQPPQQFQPQQFHQQPQPQQVMTMSGTWHAPAAPQPAPGSMYDPPVLPRLPLLGVPAMPRPAAPGDPRAYRPPQM